MRGGGGGGETGIFGGENVRIQPVDPVGGEVLRVCLFFRRYHAKADGAFGEVCNGIDSIGREN